MSESLPNPDGAPSDGAKLDAYLDGQLSAGEEAAWAARLREDDRVQAAAALQGKIDAGLARHFPPAAPTPEHLAQIAALSGKPPGPLHSNRRRWPLLAAAAVAAVVGAAWFLFNRATPHQAPFFKPTPLAEVYRNAVASGFEPYYECREPERLTAIFQRRLDAPLQLLDMPPGSRMLGLSYPGGLSRDTTAMLCRVDDQPVMVLVDRHSADRQQPPGGTFSGGNLYVHRTVRDRLVFYEVSPYDEPRAMPYLVAREDATSAR